jgi:molecular chaperone GrpE
MGKKDKKSKYHRRQETVPGNGEDIEERVEFKKSELEGVEKEIETEELEEEIGLLRKELESYKKIEEEYIGRVKRLQADYDNYRKRTLKEHIEHIKRANKDLIGKLLPVIDNFEIALESGKKLGKEKEDFYKGVKMIYENLMAVLKKENVKVIEPVGEEFNPEICEVAVTEDVKGFKEGRILEVIRKGYMIDNFLIRPAVVKVCKRN